MRPISRPGGGHRAGGGGRAGGPDAWRVGCCGPGDIGCWRRADGGRCPAAGGPARRPDRSPAHRRRHARHGRSRAGGAASWPVRPGPRRCSTSRATRRRRSGATACCRRAARCSRSRSPPTSSPSGCATAALGRTEDLHAHALRSPPRPRVRSTSPEKPPGAAARSSARPWPVLERAGYEELLPPTLRVRGHLPPGRWRRRRRAAGPLPRSRRPHSRPALRFHRQHRPRRGDHVRRRPRCRCGSATRARVYRQEPERGGRPRETLQVGAELLGDGDLAAGRRDRPAHHRAPPRGRARRTSR